MQDAHLLEGAETVIGDVVYLANFFPVSILRGRFIFFELLEGHWFLSIHDWGLRGRRNPASNFSFCNWTVKLRTFQGYI